METSIRENSKYEILTPDGWSDFSGIKKSYRHNYIKIILESFQEIKCTPEHLILTKTGFKYALDIDYKDIIKTENGEESILNYEILYSDSSIAFYDPLNVKLKNQYFANDIVNHNCEFLGSSGTLIAGWKLKELVDKIPISKQEGLAQYFKPEVGKSYVIICDVSRGKGLDYSAFHVIDVTTMPYQQTAVYRNNAIGPHDYAEVIYRVAKGYNNASVLVEINDIGEAVSHALQYDMGYEYMLFTENAGRSGKRITAGFGSTGAIDKGIRTTKIVKSIGCSILKLLIEQNQLIVNDDDTISELKTFSKRHNSYEAEPGAHDDLVMGLVLFSWMSDQQYFKDYTNINTLHSLREKTEEDLEQDMAPFGFVVMGAEPNGFDDIEIDRRSPDAWMWKSDNDEDPYSNDPYHGDYPLKHNF
jgi:hypothetical protein